MNDLFSVLEQISVLNRDNGSVFTNTERLNAIASLLRGSDYKRINADGLFHLYAHGRGVERNRPVVIVSSHVDCERHISRCFTGFLNPDTLLGTYDNAITNAAVVYLMLSGRLPDHVLVAFTGDEEVNGRGSKDVIRFIGKNNLNVRNIFVLDVTEEGWRTNADFTVENDFWDEDFGRKVIEAANQSGYSWNYIPGEPDNVPDFIPEERILRCEAYDDESWDYDEADLPCFSLCLPTTGEMHSNKGILARVISFRRYVDVLERMLNIR